MGGIISPAWIRNRYRNSQFKAVQIEAASRISESNDLPKLPRHVCWALLPSLR
jgi:hypothetical protein